MGSPLRSLTLTLTERCNLRCGYCYVPVERGRTMDDATVDAAVDLLVRHGAGRPGLALSFFGGEPFLQSGRMERAIDRLRASVPGGTRLRVVTPTNGTLLEGERLALCRRQGIELAVSVDGVAEDNDRPFAGGGDSTGALLGLLPGILALGSAVRVTARMTVTPANVGRLATNVRGLARLGFRRIVFLPAYELSWSDAAVDAWEREHERIGTWLAGVHGTGRRPPDLAAWRGVEQRLALRKPKRACGAGARLAAVDPDGGLYPCYRFVHAAGREEHRLGTVADGFTNHEALALFASLGPALARPEDGDCRTCDARDGCTFYCPALGFWMLRDPFAIPAAACRLARAEVAAIRRFAAVERGRAPARARTRLAAAAVIAAVSGAAPACYDSAPGPEPGDVTDHATGDITGDVGGDEATGGLCPVGADADGDGDEGIGPGRCPVGADADVDADGEEDGAIGPGLCPVVVDADADGDAGIGPGVCPVGPDADSDRGEEIGPGVCAGIC
jgi:uncharacterized protein